MAPYRRLLLGRVLELFVEPGPHPGRGAAQRNDHRGPSGSYLQNEVLRPYDEPPTPAQPVPGSTSFTAGAPGQVPGCGALRPGLIEDTLRSPNNRTVVLSFQRSTAARPTMDNLKILLQQNIRRGRAMTE